MNWITYGGKVIKDVSDGQVNKLYEKGFVYWCLGCKEYHPKGVSGEEREENWKKVQEILNK